MELLLQYVNPSIAALASSLAPVVFRIIYHFYPKDLHNITKMSLITLLGGFIGVGMYYQGSAFSSSLEAVKIGLLSGLSATGAFASIKHLLRKPADVKIITVEKQEDDIDLPV